MKVASFFSGCGGFDLGFKQAGFQIILANDNWLPAANSYKMNFPEKVYICQAPQNKSEKIVLSEYVVYV